VKNDGAKVSAVFAQWNILTEKYITNFLESISKNKCFGAAIAYFCPKKYHHA
jgi:hypothetical protein